MKELVRNGRPGMASLRRGFVGGGIVAGIASLDQDDCTFLPTAPDGIGASVSSFLAIESDPDLPLARVRSR